MSFANAETWYYLQLNVPISKHSASHSVNSQALHSFLSAKQFQYQLVYNLYISYHILYYNKPNIVFIM